VIVATPHPLGRAILPEKGHAVSVIDADAVTALEPLKPVPRRLSHVADDVRAL
jgi:hypothetical protein